MRHACALLLLLCTPLLSAANIDSAIDYNFGQFHGRGAVLHPESSKVETRGFVRSPNTGRHWLIGDDAEDPGALFISRITDVGFPDAAFGGGDGAMRITVPATLIAQTEFVRVHGAAIQSSGQPLVYGGLSPSNGQTGAFPGFICRLTASGSLNNAGTPFDTDGCQLIRSNLDPNEQCAVTDVAVAAFDLIVAVGNCTAPSFGKQPFIARLTQHGAFDIEFNGGIGIRLPPKPYLSMESQHFSAVVAIPDGRIAVLGEYVIDLNDALDYELGISRYDNGGGNDASYNGIGFRRFEFDLGGDNHDRARDLALGADGRLLALGVATRTDTQRSAVLLAQTLENGAMDTAFGVGGKLSDEVDGLLDDNSDAVSLERDDISRLVIGARASNVGEHSNSNLGRSFHFAFIPTFAPAGTAFLRITGETATSGSVTSPALAQPILFSVTPGAITLVSLPDAVHEWVSSDQVLSRGITIEAAADITVTAQGGRDYTSATTVLTPDVALGRRYRVLSWHFGAGSGSAMTVAATEPNTTVTITPKLSVGARTAGVPFQVVVQPGQAFEFNAGAIDLTGTTVEANQPISVMAGNSCARVPASNQIHCDETMEQMTPVERWGTRFFAAQAENRNAPYVVRFLADTTPTHVWADGELISTLDAGERLDLYRNDSTALVTSAPVSAAQFDMSCDVGAPEEPPCFGDATQLTLEPVSRWGFSYIATISRTMADDDPAEERLRIIASTTGLQSVSVDTIPLAASEFEPIGDSGYWVADIVRAPGFHRVSSQQFISVSTYAFSEQEATAHNAAVTTAYPNSDDLVLRLRANGSRDTSFGSNGVALIDHSVLANASLNSADRLVRALPLYDTIVVGTRYRHPGDTEQESVVYQLISGALFRDGFE